MVIEASRAAAFDREIAASSSTASHLGTDAGSGKQLERVPR